MKIGAGVTLSSTGWLRRVPAGPSRLLQGSPSHSLPKRGQPDPANLKVVPRLLRSRFFFFFHQSRNIRIGSLHHIFLFGSQKLKPGQGLKSSFV